MLTFIAVFARIVVSALAASFRVQRIFNVSDALRLVEADIVALLTQERRAEASLSVDDVARAFVACAHETCAVHHFAADSVQTVNATAVVDLLTRAAHVRVSTQALHARFVAVRTKTEHAREGSNVI